MLEKILMDSTIREPLEGFKDVFGQPARIKNMVANKIAESFQTWGYDQIVFPIIERATSFSEDIVGGSPWPEWNKKGVFYMDVENYRSDYAKESEQVHSLLIPEGTISVSRWLARQLIISHHQTIFPKKVFYITPCFRNEMINKLSDTKCREFTQVGVETLGCSNILSDIETLFMVCEGFKALKIPTNKMLIRLGNVEIFNKLCAESGINSKDILVLKDSMDTIAEAKAGKLPERLQPELDSVWKILNSYKLSKETVEKWKIICSTFIHTVDQKIISTLNFGDSVTTLNYVSEVLKQRGIKSIIDFTVVRSHEYYTGIVYEIDLKDNEGNVYVEVAGGGRYNKLITKFLAEKEYLIPAVGFAYGLERIVDYFNKINNKKLFSVKYWTSKNDVDTVIYKSKYETSKDVISVYSKADKLRKKGQRVDVYVNGDSLKSANEYAKNLSAKIIKLK